MEDDVTPNLPPVTGPPPPPLLTPPPAARRAQRSGRGWMVLALALAALLGFTWLGGLVFSLLSASRFSRAREASLLREVVVKDNGADAKVAIIDIAGEITGDWMDHQGNTFVNLIEEQLKHAAADDAVKAVLLKVDSPGGEVLASDDISRAVAKFQQTSRKPVVASLGAVAASGGYYVVAPCDWIVANELTITGSIGVIMYGFNYRGLLDKVGVRPEVFKSGKFKDMLRGSKSETEILPEERQMIQALVDETHHKFKRVVADGRKMAYAKHKTDDARELAVNWEEYADGRILSGNQAYELGYVDELGSFDTAVVRAAKLARIPKANLIRYERPFDLSNLFRLFGKTEGTTLKVDLGMDLPKLQAGRLYFLSGTVLH
jgi:protease-4